MQSRRIQQGAYEPREAFGVRAACCRYRRSRVIESGSKLHALQTLRDQSCLSSFRGFTLVEVMLAMAVSAIVLVAMSGVFYSAVRLRERTAAGLDEAAPVEQALSMLRRDLQGAVGPGGVLAGDFKCGNISSGLAQSLGIEFFTTSGQIKDAAPWGDIQEVSYGLRDPLPPSRNRGKDLVRSITRNLLSQNVADAEDQLLLGNIQTLEVACYDGSQWRDSWDTSLSDTTLPSAVRVRIQLATENGADPRVQPYEIVVPLLCQTRTNQVANTGGLP